MCLRKISSDDLILQLWGWPNSLSDAAGSFAGPFHVSDPDSSISIDGTATGTVQITGSLVTIDVAFAGTTLGDSALLAATQGKFQAGIDAALVGAIKAASQTPAPPQDAPAPATADDINPALSPEQRAMLEAQLPPAGRRGGQSQGQPYRVLDVQVDLGAELPPRRLPRRAASWCWPSPGSRW